MPAPYSYDLRSKAVAAVKRGEKKIKAVLGNEKAPTVPKVIKVLEATTTPMRFNI